MPLNDDYLIYPHRAYGMDQDRYDWRPRERRAPLQWPGGKAVACMVVVPLEFHMLDPAGKPFKHPGAMVTPYPDLRHYTTRDYGNRVGVYRVLDALDRAGLKAVFPVNAVLLDRIAPLIHTIARRGHEIAAYGWSTDRIHWGGLDADTERQWIADTRAAFDKAGLKPSTWMSPARQQSFATLDLIAEAGFTQCLDWEHDTVPVDMRTAHGAVSAVPLMNELDDRMLLVDRRQDEDSWAEQVLEASECLKREAPRFGGQVLGFTLTPYLIGLPFRIHALRRVLDALGDDASVWSATASEIAAAAAPSAA